jgi:hypothetical protein
MSDSPPPLPDFPDVFSTPSSESLSLQYEIDSLRSQLSAAHTTLANNQAQFDQMLSTQQENYKKQMQHTIIELNDQFDVERQQLIITLNDKLERLTINQQGSSEAMKSPRSAASDTREDHIKLREQLLQRQEAQFLEFKHKSQEELSQRAAQLIERDKELELESEFLNQKILEYNKKAKELNQKGEELRTKKKQFKKQREEFELSLLNKNTPVTTRATAATVSVTGLSYSGLIQNNAISPMNQSSHPPAQYSRASISYFPAPAPPLKPSSTYYSPAPSSPLSLAQPQQLTQATANLPQGSGSIILNPNITQISYAKPMNQPVNPSIGPLLAQQNSVNNANHPNSPNSPTNLFQYQSNDANANNSPTINYL